MSYKQLKEGKEQRIEIEEIGGTVYTVITEDAPSAKLTQCDIVKSLVSRHALIGQQRTCCLQSDGGKKNVRETNG